MSPTDSPNKINLSKWADLEEIGKELEHPTPQAILEEHRKLISPDMPETVLCGRLGELCQQRPEGLPLAYAWPAIVTAAGILVPESRIRTNLFCALVGDVETGKTTAIKWALCKLGLAEQKGRDIESGKLVYELKSGSVEGLAKLFQKEQVKGGARLLFPDELSHLMDKGQLQGAVFFSVLQSLYNNSKERLTVRAGSEIRFDCSLSILAGLVEDKFGDAFGSATTAGFYSRTIFGLCPRPHEYEYVPFDTKAESFSPVAVSVDPGVWEYTKLWKSYDKGLGGRFVENALRVATICAAFDGREVLLAEDLGPAMAFGEYQVRVKMALSPNVGETYEAKLANAIRQKLGSISPGWISKRDLHRATNANRFGPVIWDRVLTALIVNSEVERRVIKVGLRDRIEFRATMEEET